MDEKYVKKTKSKISSLVFVVIILFLLAALAVVCMVLATREKSTQMICSAKRDNVTLASVYRYASVATSTRLCSQVGTDIMARKGGSAVDAAIATLLCVGVVRCHSSGIGGDSFWTIYHRETGKVYTILSRSMAPQASNSTMFANNTAAMVEGGLSVAVPGEVMAFWEAHRRFGRLSWKELFAPAIQLAKDGFPLESTTASAIERTGDGVFDRFPNLRKLMTNPTTNKRYKTGDIVRMPELASTLVKIANEGADSFYNGSLAEDMVKELELAGGIITKEDFASYTAPVIEPLQLRLPENLTVYAPTLPSGGPVMLYILNILLGYNMTPDDLSSDEKTVLTYHRHLEAFKHAYAVRSKLGSPEGEDSNFGVEMDQLVANITSLEQGEIIRRKISDNQTFTWKSYTPSFDVAEDDGTSHISVVAPNGDAVSATSTVNLFFGSKLVGMKTGILYNNMMDDFSVPGVVNAFGVRPSPANFIKPGKRPLSSMCPAIVLDKTGAPVLVVGAAGGTRITTTTAFLTSSTLWLGKSMKEAMDAPRIHHQLLPDEGVITDNTPQWLIDGLRNKGHKMKVMASVSTPTGILQQKQGQIFSDAPGFVVDGY